MELNSKLKSLVISIDHPILIQHLVTNEVNIEHLGLYQFQGFSESIRKAGLGSFEDVSRRIIGSFPALISLKVVLDVAMEVSFFESLQPLRLVNLDVTFLDSQANFQAKGLGHIAVGLENSRDSLTSLKLLLTGSGYHPLKEEVIEALQDIVIIPKAFKTLWIWCSNASADFSRFFSRFEGITQPEELTISIMIEDIFTDSAYALSSFIAQNQGLKQLQVFYQSIDSELDEVSVINETIQRLPNLKILKWELGENQNIPVDSVIQMIDHSKALETFDLSTQGLFLDSDQLMVKLFTAIYHSKTLKDLRLRTPFDEITEAGFVWLEENLHKLKKFDRVYLKNTSDKKLEFYNTVMDKLHLIKLTQV